MSSIREQAEKIAGFSLVAYHDNPDAVRKQIAAAIEQALRDERERCAKIAETVDAEAVFADDAILRGRISRAIRKED